MKIRVLTPRQNVEAFMEIEGDVEVGRIPVLGEHIILDDTPVLYEIKRVIHTPLKMDQYAAEVYAVPVNASMVYDPLLNEAKSKEIYKFYEAKAKNQ